MDLKPTDFDPFKSSKSHKWIYGENAPDISKLLRNDVDVHAYARRQELGNILEPMKPTSLSKKIHLRKTDELVPVSMLHTLGIPEDDEFIDDDVFLEPFQSFVDHFNKYGVVRNDLYRRDLKPKVDNFCEIIKKMFESFQVNYFFFDEEEDLFLSVKCSPATPKTGKFIGSEEKFSRKSLFQTPVASTSFSIVSNTKIKTEVELRDVVEIEEPKFCGFLTAGKNTIKISEKALERSKKMFKEIEEDSTIDELAQLDSVIKSPRCSQKEEPKFEGFLTAGKKTIKILEKSLAKSKKMFQEVEEDPTIDNFAQLDSVIKSPRSSQVHQPKFEGFLTAAKKTIKISEKSLAKSKKMFQEVEEDPTINKFAQLDSVNKSPRRSQQEEPKFEGFLTAGKKTIKISEKSLANSKKMFQEVEEDPTINNFAQLDSVIKSPRRSQQEEPKFEGFLTAGQKTIKISEKSLTNSKRMFQEVEEDPTINNFAQLGSVPKTPKNILQTQNQSNSNFINFTPPTTRMKTLGLSRRKSSSLLKCSDKSFDNAKKLLEDEFQSPINTSTPKPKFHTSTPGTSSSFKTPKNSFQFSMTQEAYQSAVALMDDEENCGSILEESFLARPLKRTRLDDKFDDFEENEISEELKSKRIEIYEEQQLVIKSSSEEHRKQRPGFLFLQKQNKNRVKLKEFFDNGNPEDFTEEQLKDLGVPENVLSLNFKNTKNFKFKVENSDKNSIGISLPDNVFLPINPSNEITSKEIISAFQSAPGVDPKLISLKWIENSLKFIFLKLLKFEFSFPEKCSGVTLTPENILLQLKYRYDCEIDRVQRSVIRKIVEKDDTANKRMILFVANLEINYSKIDVELSDGWYGIRAIFDKPLIEAVKLKKIKVGTKLIMHGVELIGCENGCSPLELPPSAALKLSANSTRRVKWDTKLGVYKNPTPIPMSLNSIVPNGGLIGMMKIVILRVYPLMYAKRSKDNKFVFHSEKVERSRSTKNEVERLANVEAIYSQVLKEYENEEKATEKNRIKKQKMDVKNISDPVDLNDLFLAGYEEYQFSKEQVEILTKYREKLYLDKCCEIDSRVKQRLDKNNSSDRNINSLLKVRIIDHKNPLETVLLSIWNPVEDVLNILTEKSVIQLSNATSNDIREGYLQITAGRKALFKSKKENLLNFPETNFRRVSLLSEISTTFSPEFNEFDTVGIVVQIGNVDQKFQSVYIADQNLNILSIKFPESIKRFAYDDLIKLKSILTISNLKWRQSVCQESRLMLCFATEASVFSLRRRGEHFKEHLEELERRIDEIDVDEFIRNCACKILEVKGKGSHP